MKKCIKCNEIKDLTEFYRHKKMSDGHLNKCVLCAKKDASARHKKLDRNQINSYRRKDYRRDPEKYLNWRLRRKYGITIQELQQMKEKQHGCCAICKKACDLVIDHCHKTKKVRGLLCHTCNSSIGLLQDSPEIILNAASYVATGGV